jgi:hypothetical protein
MHSYQADWSYFSTWSGGYLTDGTTNPLDFLERVYDDPDVITLDELGDFTHDGGCTATYRTLGSWSDGYEAQITVRNTSDRPISAWRVGWNTPAGQVVDQSWNAELHSADGTVTAENDSWNGTLQPGERADFYLLGGTPPSATTVPAPSCRATVS